MALDRFGRVVRSIRIAEGILLYDMAQDFGLRSAELSAIECNRTPIPDWFIPKILEHYPSASQYKSDLIEAADERRRRQVM